MSHVHNQVIIQARMGSTRLPGKVLLKLENRLVLEHVIKRSAAAMKVDRVVVATTDLAEDDQIVAWCGDNEVPCVRGSSEDVLARYIAAANQYTCDNIIRITADCPLVDPGILDAMLCLHESMQSDYTSNVIPPTFPVGFDAEVVKTSVLQKVDKIAQLKSHREHVTMYIRENLEQFKTANLSFAMNYEKIRLTLDRPEDYQVLQMVFANFAGAPELFSLYQVLAFLEDNPEIVAINSSIDRFEGMRKSAAQEKRTLKWQ